MNDMHDCVSIVIDCLSPIYCLNGGTCNLINSGKGHTCSCADGWRGHNCDLVGKAYPERDTYIHSRVFALL